MGLFDSIRKAISSRKADDRSSLSGRVQAHPQDPAARHKLGLFLLKQGEVIEGIDQLARAAVLYEKGGFTGKALAVLRHMLRHDPANLDLVKWQIRLLAQQGHAADAHGELKRVASGGVAFASDDHRFEFFRQVAAFMPADPFPHFLIADVLTARRKPFEALFELQRAAPLVPAAGAGAEFALRMRQLAPNAPEGAEFQERCGFLWLCAGSPGEAAPLLASAAEGLRRAGKEAEASRAERVLSAVNDGTLGPGSGVFTFEEAAGRIDRPAAPVPAEPAREAEPAPAAETAAGTPVSEEERMVQDAVRRLRAKVQEEIGQTDPDARYNLGIAYREMGLLQEAAEEFRVARLSPALFLGATALLAETLFDLGDAEEALEALDEVAASRDAGEEANREARYRKAHLLLRAGREKEADEIFLSLHEEAPGYRDVEERTRKFRG